MMVQQVFFLLWKKSHNADLVRIAGMEYKDGDGQKLRRKKLHAQKKDYTTEQDRYYGAGMH